MATVAPRNNNLLTPVELADELGLPLATIYQWASRGLGPDRVRIGRHTRYRRADIDRWLDSRTIPAGTWDISSSQ